MMAAQHEEHLGAGGFSMQDEVISTLYCLMNSFFHTYTQYERRRAIEVGAGAEPEGDLEEDDDDDD